MIGSPDSACKSAFATRYDALGEARKRQGQPTRVRREGEIERKRAHFACWASDWKRFPVSVVCIWPLVHATSLSEGVGSSSRSSWLEFHSLGLSFTDHQRLGAGVSLAAPSSAHRTPTRTSTTCWTATVREPERERATPVSQVATAFRRVPSASPTLAAMSYFLPRLESGWHVDQAILAEDNRVVVVRFGHDWVSLPLCTIQELAWLCAKVVDRLRVVPRRLERVTLGFRRDSVARGGRIADLMLSRAGHSLHGSRRDPPRRLREGQELRGHL